MVSMFLPQGVLLYDGKARYTVFFEEYDIYAKNIRMNVDFFIERGIMNTNKYCVLGHKTMGEGIK